MIGNFGQKFISFFTAILITRYLGPEKYGQYTFVISFIAIVAVLWNFGFSTLIRREVSKYKDLTADYEGGVILLKTILASIVLTLVYFYLKLFDYSEVIVNSIVIFGIGTYLMSISEVFLSVFAAYRRMEYTAFIPILRALVLLGSVILITEIEGGVEYVFIAYFISFVVVLISSYSLIRIKLITPNFGVKPTFLIDVLKKAFPLVMISIVNIVLFRIDVVMLSKFRGDAEVGLYGAAYNLFELSIAVYPMMLIGASFPVLSAQYHEDIGKMKKLVEVLLKYFLIVGVPLSFGTYLLGSEVILVLYGEAYAEAGILMSLLGGAILIFFLSNLVSWTLTAMEKQNFVLYSNILAMVINVILNLIFIPSFGAMAAALTTLFSELVQLLFLSTLILKFLDVKLRPGFIKILIASITMTVFLAFMKNILQLENLILQFTIIVVSSVCVYFVLIYLMKLVKKKEFDLLLKN